MRRSSIESLASSLVGLIFVGGAIAWVFLAQAFGWNADHPPDWMTLGAGAVLAHYFQRSVQQSTGDQLTNGINDVINKARQSVRGESRKTDHPSADATAHKESTQ